MTANEMHDWGTGIRHIVQVENTFYDRLRTAMMTGLTRHRKEFRVQDVYCG